METMEVWSFPSSSTVDASTSMERRRRRRWNRTRAHQKFISRGIQYWIRREARSGWKTGKDPLFKTPMFPWWMSVFSAKLLTFDWFFNLNNRSLIRWCLTMICIQSRTMLFGFNGIDRTDHCGSCVCGTDFFVQISQNFAHPCLSIKSVLLMLCVCSMQKDAFGVNHK